MALQIGTAAYYYSFDQVKNVMELFDSAGAIAATYDYAPFGAVTSLQITQLGNQAITQFSNPLTFSSEVFDSTLGLQYYNYRHLNLLDGRWVNRDPIEEADGSNLYCMIENLLYNSFDILGLEDKEDESSIFDFVGEGPDIQNDALYLGLSVPVIPTKYLLYSVVLKVKYGCCVDKKTPGPECYSNEDKSDFFDNSTIQSSNGKEGTQPFGTDEGYIERLYLNLLNSGSIGNGYFFDGKAPNGKPCSSGDGKIPLDGSTWGSIQIKIDWWFTDSSVMANGFTRGGGTKSLLWHEYLKLNRMYNPLKPLEVKDFKRKGSQSIDIKWDCGKSEPEVKTVPEILPGLPRKKLDIKRADKTGEY